MTSVRHFTFCIIIHMICFCQPNETVKKGIERTGDLPKLRLTVQPVSHNALRVSWTLSSNITDDQLSFRLIFSPVKSPYKRRTYLELPGSYRVFVINRLLPASHYRVKMAVMWNNKGNTGMGAFSPWTVESTLRGALPVSSLTTPSSKADKTTTSRAIETATSRVIETPTSKADKTATSRAIETPTSKADKTATSRAIETPTSKVVNIPSSKTNKTTPPKTIGTPTYRGNETPAPRVVDKSISKLNETPTPTKEFEEQIPLQLTNQYSTCQEVTVPMCRGLVYNHTRMPNSLNHTTQAEAKLEIYQYFILTQTKCSPVMRFFLCSVFTPICIPEHNKVLPPCRSVCEEAWRGCQAIIKQYHISWPSSLDCKRFPDARDPNLCMDYKETTSTTAVTVTTNSQSATVPRTEPTTASTPLTFPHMRTTKCRKHRTPLCKGLYVKARFPNLLGHRRHEAAQYIGIFTPLVRYNCSPSLRYFLCIFLAPPCTGSKTPFPLPCRSLCHKTRNGCEDIMTRFRLSWPPEMDCNRFPRDGGSELCAAPVKTCKPVPVPKCQRWYNFTTPRADVSRGNQRKAAFSAVLKAGDKRCRKVLQYFLCLRQYPKCTEEHPQVVPCRSLCRKVQKRCGTEMRNQGITFATVGVSSPDFPDCKVFPHDKGNTACSTGPS